MKKVKTDKENIENSLLANKYLLEKFPNLKESIDKENAILEKRLRDE